MTFGDRLEILVMTKASRGSVTVQAVKGRLRLCWRFRGQRYWLALGYPDQPKFRKVAELKAKQLEADILYDRFDPSNLEPYKVVGRRKESDFISRDSLRAIWAEFVGWKRSQCSPSTMKSQYENFTNHVLKMDTDNPYDAVTIQNQLLRRVGAGDTTMGVVRRLLRSLNDMGKWAVRQGLMDSNPYAGMAGEIRLPKTDQEKTKINPFTAAERDLILQKFQESRFYAYYTPFVSFMFKVGCRPSEALGLTWRQVDRHYKSVLFDQALVDGEDGLEIKQGLKTQENRTVVLSQSVQTLLRSLKATRKKTGPNDLVFPGPRGSSMRYQNFAKKGWATILSECNLSYRNPYQTRHTFITLALQGGMSATDIAKLVGNSADVIYKHYAGISRDLRLPEV